MGSTTPPKVFARQPAYGQSSATNVTTQAQPVPQVSGAGLPADSGFSQAPANPAVSADPTNTSQNGGLISGDGSQMNWQQQLLAMRGQSPMPFFG